MAGARLLHRNPCGSLRWPGDGEGWQAHWTPEGGGTSGEGSGRNHREVMARCRRLIWDEPVDLPPGTRAYVGRSWLEADHDDTESPGPSRGVGGT